MAAQGKRPVSSHRPAQTPYFVLLHTNRGLAFRRLRQAVDHQLSEFAHLSRWWDRWLLGHRQGLECVQAAGYVRHAAGGTGKGSEADPVGAG